MGYTRYWDRTDKPITKEFIDKVKAIIKDSEEKGIHICGSDGKGEPELELDYVGFNGNGDLNLDHETCFFDSEQGFNFCKTARKPYDYTVRKVLEVAEEMGIIKNVSSDGENEGIYSDADYVNGNVER